MILLFPNYDALRLALTSSIVPADISLAPAAVSFDEQGKIYIESTAALTRTAIKNLDKIGVKGSKRHASESLREVTCWPQILPLEKEAGSPVVSNQAPVLFELSDPDDLPALVAEMLRLGNDRQSFRWFDSPFDEALRCALLRVVGPPYYTLLRALDPSTAGTKGTVRAYVERAPRVWVELGRNHPLASQIRVADGQLLLLRAPRDWIYLDETPFQDVYEILQFELPTAPVEWQEAASPDKISVPLRLTAGNAADVPELWVLRERAIEQLDALVRDSDERLTQRLKFAVASDSQGGKIAVLRTLPSKLPPPALSLENALGFKPFWKLPNLFVPVGRRLHPTLRRDAVRKLLSDDPDQLVWLYPGEGGNFTPESVLDGAFRSLEDWVSYTIEAERDPLSAWIEATRFDFDHFVCPETSGPKNKPDKGERDKGKDETDDGRGLRGQSANPKPSSKAKPGNAKFSAELELMPSEVPTVPPNEWIKKRIELEERFKAIDGGHESDERQGLWPELAAANAGAGDSKPEAAICWLNAMWGVESIPLEWITGWMKSELPTLSGGMRADDFDRRLAEPGPGLEEARIVVASFLWLAAQTPIPSWLPARLPALQAYLEKHESALPVRAVWLAGYRLSQLSGSDVLGLARVRDRLLQRLLEQGLTAERDLPMFLRVAGLKDSERLRIVNERAMELHGAVRKWTEHIPVNLPYVDLLFAFALGKLGESTKAKNLVEDARKVMEVPIPTSWQDNKHSDAVVAATTSNFLFKALKYRIDLAVAGKPHTSQLTPELLNELEEIANKDRKSGSNNPFKTANYVIARMRFESRILEPHEKLDPYFDVTKSTDLSLRKEIGNLHSTRDPNKLVEQIRKLYKNGLPDRILKEVQFYVLHEALPLSSRAGEAFTVELLQLVPSALECAAPKGTPEANEIPKKQGELLERALFLAAHFDRGDLVKKLLDAFSELIRSKPEDARFKLINAVAGQCLKSLKKLGMRSEIDGFLGRLKSEILHGATSAELRKKYASKPELWASVLQTLLNLAAGWLTHGLNEQAKPILDEARNELLNPGATKLGPKEYSELARAYVAACGQFPSELGLARITELFQKMNSSKITNTWTGSRCYSRFHLMLVEDVVHAIVSDDFALGPTGRRWLDDDEYLVRRRIHADMKREREKSGL